jgi:hypothetical protein
MKLIERIGIVGLVIVIVPVVFVVAIYAYGVAAYTPTIIKWGQVDD